MTTVPSSPVTAERPATVMMVFASGACVVSSMTLNVSCIAGRPCAKSGMSSDERLALTVVSP